MCSNNWDSFWNALNAIGTLSAVLVSLHLASRKKKAELSLHKHRTYHKDGKIDLIITIKNLGDAPIAITEFGFSRIVKRDDIFIDCHTFLKDEFQLKPVVILAGNIHLIQFELDPSIKPEYKIVKKQIENRFYTFVVRDSENKHYSII